MLALALIAVGVFMGVVLYGNGDGGRLGHALAVALGWSVGRAKVLAPIALVGAGAAMLMRPVLPAMRPLRTGSLCLFAAVVLALAAGTLGVELGQGTPASHWSSGYLQAHGGAGGQALYEVAHRLVQQVGVDILVVFLLVVGLILLTGASLAAVLRATGSGMVDSTRMLKARVAAERRARAAIRRAAQAGDSSRPKPAALDSDRRGRTGRWRALLPPEPEPGKLVVRATHVEAPSLDGDRPLEPVDPWAEDEVRRSWSWSPESPELEPEPEECRRPPRAERRVAGADPRRARRWAPRTSPLKAACAST